MILPINPYGFVKSSWSIDLWQIIQDSEFIFTDIVFCKPNLLNKFSFLFLNLFFIFSFIEVLLFFGVYFS